MAANKILIHQAFYGEVSRAHSCISQTLDDPELTSFLTVFTDRPAALLPGVMLLPYISGSAHSKYYVFSKTFPDSSATRAGMVFTHVLILNLEDVVLVNNLQDVFSNFVASIEDKDKEIKERQIELSDSPSSFSDKRQPKYIQETISTFISGTSPILLTGDISAFTNALQIIWNSPNILSRKKVKFRTSFTLTDIDGIKDLTIVSIQRDFLPKWQGQKIIQGDSDEMVEITSHSEALFLGHKTDNPFYNFLLDLNVNLSEVQHYSQYEKVFINYSSLDKLEDANILRQDIRTLAKFSPSASDAKVIKAEFLEKLSMLIQQKKDSNIKALRNIDWKAFNEGEEKGREIVLAFMEKELSSPNQENIQSLSELIEISVTETEQNWWHETISKVFTDTLKSQKLVEVTNVWRLIDFPQSSIKNLFSLLSKVKDCDTILRNNIPEQLKKETCKAIVQIADKKKWYLLHADILLKFNSIEDSVEKQLVLEQKLVLADSIGVKYLVLKLSPEQLIALTLKIGDVKLIELSVEAIEKDVSLLGEIDITVLTWLQIWTALVNKTKRLFEGLHGKEKKIVSSIFDLILNGTAVDEIIIEKIADSSFADLSDYKNRKNVWDKISNPYKEKFLKLTTQQVFESLLEKKINANAIEEEICERITSDSFITKFLNDNRNSIGPVIIVFSNFANLKDGLLADYIAKYGGIISEEQAKQLGDLVNGNNFTKSARSIYDKAKYYGSFNPAYEICKGLVSLNWWETMWSFGSTPQKSFRSNNNPIMSKEDSMRADLPTIIILTAIKEEYAAVREHLSEVVDADKNDTSYEAGLFRFNGKEVAKVIIRECGAKNTNAAQETERAIQYFKPDMILFVGIAGSRKPKDFTVGDVIFPEKIYSYEGGKSEKETFLSRPDNALMSYSLLEKAKKERLKNDWKTIIKGNWQQDVKADIGVIASGEQVVEHYESQIGKILHDHFNDTSAVEMEGFGFGKAANRQGRETSNILIGVVRGISDVIEQPSKKEKEKETDRRPDNVKNFASATASAFAFWLILKTYE